MNFTKKKKNILDEDQYLDDLEYIIKRDFFPDSELIELQLKYYDALDAQDFAAIKEIQLKLNKINQSFNSAKCSVEDTPVSNSNEIPYKNPNMREERDLHLDQYLSRNTSEDNFSYSDLQQQTLERQLKRLSGAFKAAKEYNAERFQSLQPSTERKAIGYNNEEIKEVGADMSSFIEYKVFNPVFFNPETVPLSKEERISLAGKKSEVVYENTRFKAPLNRARKPNKIGKSTLNNIPGKIGPDGKEIYDGSTPRVGGYSIMANSLTPYDMTPDMTWGELGGTPMLLTDSPTMQSQFKMQEPSEREKIASEMASRSSRKNKENKQQALARVRSSLISGGGSSFSSYKSHMTPAALKLLSRLTPYTPHLSLSRPGSSVLSRPRHTPSLATRHTPSLAKATPTPNPCASITDNLLDL